MVEQKYLESQLESDFMKDWENEERCKQKQFGIRDLFGLMTYTAIGLAVGKTLVEYSIHTKDLDPYIILFFGMLTSSGYTINNLAKKIQYR